MQYSFFIDEKFIIYIADRESFQCTKMAPEVVSLDFSVLLIIKQKFRSN